MDALFAKLSSACHWTLPPLLFNLESVPWQFKDDFDKFNGDELKWIYWHFLWAPMNIMFSSDRYSICYQALQYKKRLAGAWARFSFFTKFKCFFISNAHRSPLNVYESAYSRTPGCLSTCWRGATSTWCHTTTRQLIPGSSAAWKHRLEGRYSWEWRKDGSSVWRSKDEK